MSALNVKIGNRAKGSRATPPKLTACMIYGLGLALSCVYNAYLYIPISKNYSSLLLVDTANTLLANHVKSVCVCQFVRTFSHAL